VKQTLEDQDQVIVSYQGFKEKSNMALNASTFDFMPLIQGYPALKFGRSGMAREKVFYLSGI